MRGSKSQAACDTQRRLLIAVAACVLVFLVASVAAAVGYASWMWLFVFTGLVISPVVMVVLVAMVLWNRRTAKEAA